MYVTATPLQYWKSEHGPAGCEDAVGVHIEHGLFAVADGVSSTAFAQPWARHVVEEFVHAVPLLSADPFELEWWVRGAQASYVSQGKAPDLSAFPEGTLREKAEAGAATTMATLRCVRQPDGAASFRVITIGDSCVLLDYSGHVTAFPAYEGVDFDARPKFLHSRWFDRGITEAKQVDIVVHPGVVVVLATDAVARWVLEAGTRTGASSLGYSARSAALQTLAGLDPGKWPMFVDACRERREMVDDDATALVLRFSADLPPSMEDARLLGETTSLPEAMRSKRQSDLNNAIERGDSVAIARLAGDYQQAGLDIDPSELGEKRRVAEEVLQAIAAVVAALNREPPSKANVNAVWLRYAELLEREPSAAHLRQTLVNERIRTVSGRQIVAKPAAPDG